MTSTPRNAGLKDVPAVHALIMSYAERRLLLPRALTDIYEKMRDFFVCEEHGRIVACAALHIVWADLAEVRSLAVAEPCQGRGMGSALVQCCVDEARRLRLPRIFTLTYQEAFFARHGFRRIEKEKLPHQVWADCVKCPHFPDCDEIAMTLDLPTGGSG